MLTHGRKVALRPRVPLLAFALASCAIASCAIFPTGDPDTRVHLRRTTLPPIQASSDAIQLEILFVDRPADDPLLGQSLWREVDQIGAIPSETREMLLRNGFQIGHVASSPPMAVQSLLGLVSDASFSDTSGEKQLTGTRRLMPPGMETEIQASDAFENCEVSIVEGQRSKSYEYEQVRFMFRMKSARLPDGWVRIDFQPEIHHGDLRLRHTATESGEWAYSNRQKVDAKHAQQFSLTLNVGEIAIITAASDHPGSMGDWFFCRDQDGTRRQRLLIVRVADAGKSPDSF